MLLVHLDAEGCAYVSQGVLDDLDHARNTGLSPHQLVVLNVLPDPPPVTLFMPGPDGTPNEQAKKSHHAPTSFQQVGDQIHRTAPQTSGQVVHWDRRKLYA